MIERAIGLVLRLRPLTETSLIVHWLTPAFGRLATVAKGALRPKSPFRGRLDLFYLADFSFSRSRSSELHQLRELSLRKTHEFLRQDIESLQQAAYCVRLIEHATETETPLETVFEMLQGFLDTLAGQGRKAPLLLCFEVKLLAELGLQPDLSKARLTGGASAMFRKLEELDWSQVSRLRLNPSQQTELQHYLHGFLLFHLGRIPKGREAVINPSAEKVTKD